MRYEISCVDNSNIPRMHFPGECTRTPRTRGASLWHAGSISSKIRQLFEEGFRPEVMAKVLILESFTTESLVGIRKTSHEMEVIHLRARSSIGDTEY